MSLIKNSITEYVNQEVLNLWDRTFKENDDVYMPLMYHEIKQADLLFISLNPSFNPISFQSTLKEANYPHINIKEFYHWKNRANFDLKKAQEIDGIGRNNHKSPFFKKMKDIAIKIDVTWEHVDLFFLRITGQQGLKEKVCFKRTSMLNEFGQEQLKLSSKLIMNVRAKVIVVANACASKIINRDLFAKQISFDNNMGYHKLRLTDKEIPLFLTSPLNGQRAIDNFSLERLIWQIGQAVRTTKSY